MPQQMTQELADFQLSDILEPKLVAEAQAMASGADGDPRDHRDFVPSIAVTVDGVRPRGTQVSILSPGTTLVLLELLSGMPVESLEASIGGPGL